MNMPHRFAWVVAVWLLASMANGGAAELLSATIRIQPIQVCSDDGTVCANPNRNLFEAETRKIWAQAGTDIEFLPWRKFYGTPWLHLGTSLFGDTYSIFTLASIPGRTRSIRQSSIAGSASSRRCPTIRRFTARC